MALLGSQLSYWTLPGLVTAPSQVFPWALSLPGPQGDLNLPSAQPLGPQHPQGAAQGDLGSWAALFEPGLSRTES